MLEPEKNKPAGISASKDLCEVSGMPALKELIMA